MLNICLRPGARFWRLGPLPPPAGALLLIGWRESGGVDSGVPPAVRTVLAQALVQRFHLTFLDADRPRYLISTGEAGAAERLFDQPAWSYQAQVALLSPPDVALPLDAATVAALLTDCWLGGAAGLSAKGVIGALRPGVDGDVAGLWLADGRAVEDQLDIIEAAARRHGLTLTIADEDGFAALLSGA